MKLEPREVWVQRVQRLADSGLTVKEFASEMGVNPHTLAGWRWRLARESVERATSPRMKFLDVTAEAGRAAAAPAEGAERFEVVLLSGIRIRIPSRFDATLLRSLVTALEVA